MSLNAVPFVLEKLRDARIPSPSKPEAPPKPSPQGRASRTLRVRTPIITVQIVFIEINVLGINIRIPVFKPPLSEGVWGMLLIL